MIEAGKSSHMVARKRIEATNFKKSFSEIRRMASDLDHMLSDIDELNNELEAKVITRTIELENAKHDLETVIEDLKAAQAQLISHEKMAALGQLVSGIAHELNTPLGVVSSAVGTLDSIIKNEFDKFINFRVNAPEGAIRVYDELIRQSVEKTNKNDPAFMRQLKNIYYKAAEDNKMSIPNEVIEHLADIGFTVDENEFVSMLREPGVIDSIHAAYSVVTMNKSIRMIKNSAEKASHVISALKTYARRDSNQHVVPHDVIKDIEMVLTLYYNQTKYGVEIIKKYQDVMPVLCYPEKLHQVWVNIINNALHAMNYKGKLEISVDQVNGFVRVSITDDGPGIPDEIREKIFEPFFSTKKLGEGTGLGLDIVKRTLDEIGGQIAVESKHGKTTFNILLINAKAG
jgi:signal transduction histidine kinase